MRSLRMKPREEVYNGMILNAEFEEIKLLLEDMNSLDIRPSINTINAWLFSMEKFSKSVHGIGSGTDVNIRPTEKVDPDKIIRKMEVVMAEMKRLNLSPNLTTYHLMLSCLDPISCQKVLYESDQNITSKRTAPALKVKNIRILDIFLAKSNRCIKSHAIPLRITRIYRSFGRYRQTILREGT